MPQSQIADQPNQLIGSDTEDRQPHDIKHNKSKADSFISSSELSKMIEKLEETFRTTQHIRDPTQNTHIKLDIQKTMKLKQITESQSNIWHQQKKQQTHKHEFSDTVPRFLTRVPKTQLKQKSTKNSNKIISLKGQ